MFSSYMRLLAAALIAAAMYPTTATAQETRTEVLEKQRADKATQLKPYEVKKLEKLVMQAEEGRIRRLITPHNGFFAEYGYTYRPAQAGIGFGGGFRHDLFDRRARVELEGGITLRNYHMLRADFALPRLFDDHLELGVEASYKYHPQEDFYGAGIDSLQENRTNYEYTGTEYQGRAVFKPRSWLRLGSRFSDLATSVGSGTDDRFPSIETMFDDQSAPGLAAQPDYLYADAFATIDYRDERGNARDGGYYSVALKKYSDRTLDRYSFTSVDMLFQQFVPIFDKKRVFAFQTGIITTSSADGQEVPFFMRPTVGGSRTLRSVSEYRFRDTNALWINAEYRWEAFGLLDMALFTDFGHVAAKPSDLSLSDLKHGYGIGFRLKTAQAVFFRFDIGVGAGEGIQYVIKYSRAF
jgi:hypothetical protein